MERMEKNGVEVLPKNVVAAHLSNCFKTVIPAIMYIVIGRNSRIL